MPFIEATSIRRLLESTNEFTCSLLVFSLHELRMKKRKTTKAAEDQNLHIILS